MKRAVIVQGLAFGDEGKGATVDFLARELAADLVVRYCGGSQAAHHVELAGGAGHTFSQFGAGTLADAATHLSQHVIIHPGALHAEAEHLKSLGVKNPWRRLTAHPHALVTTLYAQGMNRLRELARGDARHGSCGHGIGETRSYWLKYGRDAITAGDLAGFDVLADKLELQRQRLLLELPAVGCKSAAAHHLAEELYHRSSLDAAEKLHELGRPLQRSSELPPFQTAIFEGAQGVLLDEWRGFHPHTTWSTVTQHHALELIAAAEVDEVCALGVTRAYATRHGAGPLPTEDAEMQVRDASNPWNAWQHGMRFGRLDLVLLEYAAALSGGPLDGLVVNHLDQIGPQSPVAVAYEGMEQLPISPAPDLAHQEVLGEQLFRARPVYQTFSKESLLARLGDVAPMSVTARGRTWRDRRLHGLTFRSRPAACDDAVAPAIISPSPSATPACA